LISGKILHGSTGKILLPHIRRTETLYERTRGLLGSRFLDQGYGLLITPCNSIHTLFMRMSIDVLFLNRNNTIMAMKENMHPFRFAMCYGAASVLELMAGQIRISGMQNGDRLVWEACR
jgi:hypothetical protein